VRIFRAASGNRTQLSSVTGWHTNRYTNTASPAQGFVRACDGARKASSGLCIRIVMQRKLALFIMAACQLRRCMAKRNGNRAGNRSTLADLHLAVCPALCLLPYERDTRTRHTAKVALRPEGGIRSPPGRKHRVSLKARFTPYFTPPRPTVSITLERISITAREHRKQDSCYNDTSTRENVATAGTLLVLRILAIDVVRCPKMPAC